MTGEGSNAVTVRLATESDGPLLLAWRNDPEVRGWSRSSAVIAPETHAEWLRRSLATADRHVLVVCAAGTGEPLGTARYDLLPSAAARRSRWEISIAVAPGQRGRGLGSATVDAADAWLFSAEPEAREIVAWIRPANLASQRLFERQGYRPAGCRQAEMDCYVRARPGA